MSSNVALIVGVTIGAMLGSLLVPLTRRELAAAVDRSIATQSGEELALRRSHRASLIVASGLLPGLVLFRSGWSINALPPLALLLGLVPLAYCDLTKLLLPKTMVHATTALVSVAVVVAAGVTDTWHRALVAAICGLGLFVVLFAINLANPAWIAFGDVRLAPAVGLGLAWVSPTALMQGFFLANVLAAVIGLILIGAHKAGRSTALPFGLFLAIASAMVIFAWS